MGLEADVGRGKGNGGPIGGPQDSPPLPLGSWHGRLRKASVGGRAMETCGQRNGARKAAPLPPHAAVLSPGTRPCKEAASLDARAAR